MRVADGPDATFAGQRLIQVHCPAAGDEKAISDAEVGNELQDVVGKLDHRFLWYGVRPEVWIELQEATYSEDLNTTPGMECEQVVVTRHDHVGRPSKGTLKYVVVIGITACFYDDIREHIFGDCGNRFPSRDDARRGPTEFDR